MTTSRVWLRVPGDYSQWPFPETQRSDHFVILVEENPNWMRERVTLLAACPTAEAAQAAFRLMRLS